MVTVTVVSDLHLEARPLDLESVLDPDLSADVLCLLGDIGDPASDAYRAFISAAAGRFPTVLLLAGNNEYRNPPDPHDKHHHHRHHHHHHHQHHHHHHRHSRQHSSDSGKHLASGAVAAHPAGSDTAGADAGSSTKHHGGDAAAAPGGRSMAQTEALIRSVAAAHPNVHFLQNETHVVGGVAFIGTTLWTHIPDDPLPIPEEAEEAPAATAAPPPSSSGSQGGTGDSTGAAGAGLSSSGDGVATAAAEREREAGGSRAVRASGAERDGSGGGALQPFSSLRPPVPPRPSAAGALPSLASPTAPVAMPGNLRGAGTAAAIAPGDATRCPLAPPPTLARSLPAPPPRFERHSVPASLLSPIAAAAAASADGGAGRGAQGACGAGIPCCVRRRLMLRHSVSLASLAPDAPCPPLFVSRELSAGSSSSSLSRSSDSGTSGSSDSESGGTSGSGSDSDGGRDATGGTTSAPVLAERPPPSLLVPQLAAMQLRSLSGTANFAGLPPTTSSLAAALAVAPPQPTAHEPASQSHQHSHSHHHHHHHHHRRHPSTSHPASTSAPTTVREYIHATSLDYRRILSAPGGPPITPESTNALFAASLAYVTAAAAAARAAGLVPVVLSHHAPTLRGTSHPRFAGHPSTHAYGTELEDVLARSGIAVWYCGHTHHNFDMTLPGGVRLASNQFGSQPQPGAGYSRSWRQTVAAGLAPRGGSGGLHGLRSQL